MKKLIVDFLKKIEEDVIPNVSENQLLNNLAQELIFKIENHLKFKTTLEGSLSKGTNLKNKNELDLFIQIPLEENPEPGLILDSLKKIMESPSCLVFQNYLKHPYLTLKISKDEKIISVDLVPILISKDRKIVNPVEQTIYHSKFINDHLSDEQKKDVRVLKKLLDLYHLYGAETYLNGFSGYCCEILIYRYGSLEKLIYEFKPVVKKKELIFMDPVFKTRNLGASCSLDNLGKMIHLFYRLKRGEIPEEVNNYRENTYHYLLTTDSTLEKSYKTVKKVYHFLTKEFKNSDLNLEVLVFPEEFNKMIVIIPICYFKGLKIVKGPPLDKFDHYEAFRNKHDQVFTHEGYFWAKTEVEISLNNFIHNLGKNPDLEQIEYLDETSLKKWLEKRYLPLRRINF